MFISQKSALKMQFCNDKKTCCVEKIQVLNMRLTLPLALSRTQPSEQTIYALRRLKLDVKDQLT